MAMQQLQTDLSKIFRAGRENEKKAIPQLELAVASHGANAVNRWRNSSDPKQNGLLHELVERGWTEALIQLLEKFPLEVQIQRNSDGVTPLKLAIDLREEAICDVLKRFGATEVLTEDVSKWHSEEDKEKLLNIAWVDLEMTSLEDPEIIECAVIITDKHLKKIARANWVIHFEQAELAKLGTWHQNTFKDIEDGGNGLFADSIRSRLTKKEVEQELLDLLKQHCLEKQCPLAGSSIHIDKDVLKRCMPRVHDFMHYRIIDVSSFQAIMKRWAPRTESKMKRHLATNGQETVNHRAMDDIEWSISLMSQFKPLLEERPPRNQHQEHHGHYPKRGSYESPEKHKYPMVRQNSNSAGSQLYADEKRLLERMQFEVTFDMKSLCLSPDKQKLYERNPHLRELFVNYEPIQRREDTFSRDNRVLLISSSFSSDGRFDAKKPSTLEHWGQRKLLLTEIEFLTNFGLEDQYLVIYVGAAPGIYMEYLSSLFPDLRFRLFDTKKFALRPTSKIEVRPEPFSDQIAKRYGAEKKKILFICNVRTFNDKANPDLLLVEDMQTQRNWCELLQPHASLLNFRPLVREEKMKYLQGDLIIEPWASKRTTECRLVVMKNAKSTSYNTRKFVDAMQHFHYVDRLMYYENDMDHVETEGLDHCYDCRAEIFILNEYLGKGRKFPSNMSIRKEIARMSQEISVKIEDPSRPQFLARPRTLDTSKNQPSEY